MHLGTVADPYTTVIPLHSRSIEAAAPCRHQIQSRLRTLPRPRGRGKNFGKIILNFAIRLVPNATEQAVIERMKAMRANGATYREIGGEVGLHGRTVQRILDRT